MPLSKNQLLRMVRFVAQLKENRYPNCRSFAEDLRRSDIDDNRNLACCCKTIQRDINVLKTDFGCPLFFDHERQGYRLKHHGWDFACPPLFDEHELLAAVLGARVAEDIFPEPLKSSIRQAVDCQLTSSNPDFLDRAMVKSLTVVPGLSANIAPEIFMQVFNAWIEHEALDIVYSDVKSHESERRIEPHALVYYASSWYIKGICLLRGEIRNFAVHRILHATKSGRFFSPDDKIINSVLEDRFLEYEKVSGIELLCDEDIKSFVSANPLHREQQLTPAGERCFRLYIPAVPEHEIIQWTLYQAGKVEIVKPAELRLKVGELAQKIAKKHAAGTTRT